MKTLRILGLSLLIFWIPGCGNNAEGIEGKPEKPSRATVEIPVELKKIWSVLLLGGHYHEVNLCDTEQVKVIDIIYDLSDGKRITKDSKVKEKKEITTFVREYKLIDEATRQRMIKDDYVMYQDVVADINLNKVTRVGHSLIHVELAEKSLAVILDGDFPVLETMKSRECNHALHETP